jgi:hypothetical protein
LSSVRIAQSLDRELGGSEKVLWSGIPRQGLLLRSADAFLIPFSLLWAGFTVFWEHSAIAAHTAPFLVFWGIPFLLFGAYFVVGRFLLDSYQRARTCYALTDTRIIIVSGLLSREVKTLPLETLAETTLRERSDGSGTIFFGPMDPRYALGMSAAWPGMGRRTPPSFELIPRARSVYDQILAAQTARIRTRS